MENRFFESNYDIKNFSFEECGKEMKELDSLFLKVQEEINSLQKKEKKIIDLKLDFLTRRNNIVMNRMSDDSLFYIFQFLGVNTLLETIIYTCKRFNNIAMNDMMWNFHLKQLGFNNMNDPKKFFCNNQVALYIIKKKNNENKDVFREYTAKHYHKLEYNNQKIVVEKYHEDFHYNPNTGMTIEVNFNLPVEKTEKILKNIYKHPLVSHHGSGCGWELRVCSKLLSVMLTVEGVGHKDYYVNIPKMKTETWYHLAVVISKNLEYFTVFLDGEKRERVFIVLSRYKKNC